MAMQCAKCGITIDPKEAANPCSKCGSIDRFVPIDDGVKVLDMKKVVAKTKQGFKLFERKYGEKVSNYGHIAREFLDVNRQDPDRTTKTHIVEEEDDQGDWEIKHSEYKEFPSKRRPKNNE